MKEIVYVAWFANKWQMLVDQLRIANRRLLTVGKAISSLPRNQCSRYRSNSE